MPVSGKWAKAGMVRTGGIEVAWRQMDAQYWGVPQRRKRIFLVGDFGGQRAGEILFKCESLLGYSQTGGTEKKEIAADFGKRAENASRNYRTGNSELQCVYELAHANEVIRQGKENLCPTLQARMGTGGNQMPMVLDYIAPCVYPISDAVINGGANGLGIGKDGDPAPTLTGRDRHGIAFFEPAICIQGSLVGRKIENGPQGTGINENVSFTLNTTDRHAVAWRKRIRKLTPLECERLQGYPDEWTRYGVDGKEIKDSPRYVAIGNSLAVPCAERVFRGIVEALSRKEE